jgi:hypothetical protein
MEVSGKLHVLTALPPVPIEYEAGWAPDSVCRLLSCTEEYFVPAGNRIPTVTPIQAPRYGISLHILEVGTDIRTG